MLRIPEVLQTFQMFALLLLLWILACARGSVLLITASMSIRTRALSVPPNDRIPDVCTAAAVDTACSLGSVVLITYWYLYQYEYVQGHCLSLETNVSVLA